MNAQPKQIFVDTWAWCALANRRDTAHQEAQKLNKKLVEESYHYVTANFVLSESYTLIRSRIGYNGAIEFGNKIQNLEERGSLEAVRIDKELEQAAGKLFVKYDDIKDLSFTDCISFAVMNVLSIDEAFTGDAHFYHVGFIQRNSVA